MQLELVQYTDPLDMRLRICRLEAEMRAQASSFYDLPTEHLFAPGIYIRKVFIAKGVYLVAKIHKHFHSNIISQGKVFTVTEFGIETHQAYTMFNSPAGTKRAVAALEDTIWCCVHLNPTNTTDLKAVEDFNIAKSYTELGMEDPVLQLEGAV